MKRMRRKEIRKKQNKKYTVLDAVVDVLLFIPELILLPFRLLLYLGRGLARMIGDLLNIW